MRRFSAALLAALFIVGVLAPAAFAASTKTAAAGAVPKVVLIVGPAGTATESYRAQARAAAAIARIYTPDVVELYSPDATWPAVKQALDGASLVVYMGHGNGWPSRYRDALYPPSEDGFGLNPTPGGDDATHQYFGEADIAAQVRLAKNAVVLLNHLCYASGLSEPELPEGTLGEAQQRVDNYAAGFVRAGAAAVVADAWSSPSYMVKAILGGGHSIQSAWQGSPAANGHRLAFSSVRSPGFVAQMDTETATSGFTRSIVMKAGLAPKDVLAGAAGSTLDIASLLPLEPTLVGTGIKLGPPDIAKLPSAGTTGKIDVPYTIKDRKALPKSLEASIRWDPIDLSIVPEDPTTQVGVSAPAPSGPAVGNGSGVPAAVRSMAAAGAAAAGAATTQVELHIDAPTEVLDLVVPEQAGDVVAPAPVAIGKKALSVPVTFPTVPGRYRLTISLHDGTGVAFDAATQAMLPALVVRVTGDFDGAIQVAATADVTTGADIALGARVVNLGRVAWGHQAVTTNLDLGVTSSVEQPAHVVAHWVPLTLAAGAVAPTGPEAQPVGVALPVGIASGASFEATLHLTAPSAPGQYLLLLDIVTPERGSLVASGADPTLVRVSVAAPAK